MFEKIRKWWNTPILAKCLTCGTKVLTASPKERFRTKNKKVRNASIFYSFLQLITVLAWGLAVVVIDNIFMLSYLSFFLGMAFWQILGLTASKFNDLFALEKSCSINNLNVHLEAQ